MKGSPWPSRTWQASEEKVCKLPVTEGLGSNRPAEEAEVHWRAFFEDLAGRGLINLTDEDSSDQCRSRAGDLKAMLQRSGPGG